MKVLFVYLRLLLFADLRLAMFDMFLNDFQALI